MLDPDVRPYLGRVEQAAWDVLMNKAVWRRPDPARRTVWEPDGGTISEHGDMLVAVDATARVLAELFDRWEEFPLDLETRVRAPDALVASPANHRYVVAQPTRFTNVLARPLGNSSARSSGVNPNCWASAPRTAAIGCSAPSASRTSIGRMIVWKSGTARSAP
jgi:hypothetical protein